MESTLPSEDLPRSGTWFPRFFAAYGEWLLKRNFHSLRILGDCGPDRFDGKPLVLYSNHPSWWDPIVALVIWRRLMGGRRPYAPMDAAMLEKYGFFKRLGFFAVDKQSPAGLRRFLRTGSAILNESRTLLFFTPQGRFADVREKSPAFEPGLGHLAARTPDAVFVPVAIEFAYWEERTPEILLRFGEPSESGGRKRAAEWTAEFEMRLATAMQELAAASIARDSTAFQNLFKGRARVNVIYDTWRHAIALIRGKSFTSAHGTK